MLRMYEIISKTSVREKLVDFTLSKIQDLMLPHFVLVKANKKGRSLCFVCFPGKYISFFKGIAFKGRVVAGL